MVYLHIKYNYTFIKIMIIQIKLGKAKSIEKEKKRFYLQLYFKYRNVIILNYNKKRINKN